VSTSVITVYSLGLPYKGSSFHLGNIDPEFRVAYGGSGVSFSCLGNKDTVWSKEGEPLQSYIQKLTNSQYLLVIYTIFNVKYEDAGVYTCSGRGKQEGSETSWATHAELQVAGKV